MQLAIWHALFVNDQPNGQAINNLAKGITTLVTGGHHLPVGGYCVNVLTKQESGGTHYVIYTCLSLSSHAWVFGILLTIALCITGYG